jgi:HD-GYP domain-containing protein (c-di-GMP phosphodiesterase class II)
MMEQRLATGRVLARRSTSLAPRIVILGGGFAGVTAAIELAKRCAVLVRALEARGTEAGSLRRLAAASRAVADHLELSPTQREALELGALLHDIGEIRVPEAILKKAEALTPDEWITIQRHPEWGVELLETVPLLTPALDVVGSHHERCDGSGYPHGLKTEEIPITARIFAVVDTLDAMTHARPHRPARPLAVALAAVCQGNSSTPGSWRR